jgi:diguanylate cyclase (GGDEF)-like protein/PAS domain S-box-containing protein
MLLERGSAQQQAQRRVRLATYATLVALAVSVALAAWFMFGLERLRGLDAELIESAAQQRAKAHELGRQGLHLTQIGATPVTQEFEADKLRALLQHAHQHSRELDARLAEHMRLSDVAAHRLEPVVGRWHVARERLWHRAEVAVSLVDRRDEDALRQAMQAMQDEVLPAAQAARGLAEELRNAAGERSGQLRTGLAWGLVVLLGLVLLLAVALVEPAARAVGRQVQREAELANEMKRLAVVAENTDNVVLITDPHHRVEWANQAFTRLVGYTLEEVRGRTPSEFAASPLMDAALAARLQCAIAEGRGLREEIPRRTRDGRDIWFDADLRPVHDADGLLLGFVSVSSDVTERRRLQQQLRQHAHTDALTQLPNRVSVMERLTHALEHAARHPGYGFAVLFMDFDRFKLVNDTLGHAAGDELLRQVANRLRHALRPGDALARLHTDDVAARLGGDEFVVVLEGVHDQGAVVAVAERVLHELSEPYTIGHTPVQSSVSVGVVLVRGGAALPMPKAEDVLRNADIAMYEAKRAGRDRVVLFDESMHARAARQLELENELRCALRDDELFVVYQPLLDLPGRRLAGVEALVRWRHPRRGLVPPLEFIPAAEECGLIDELGAQVLDKACGQFMAWQATLGARAPALLAVNVSRAQLQRPGLVQELHQVLERHGMLPGQLQVEVTESLAAQDEHVQNTLRQVKQLGVRLALDDFGTGYSSLACLHQLPVDTVKIDRSFVQHAHAVEYHRVLIEATIRVARTLGMQTVAEGIETEEQAALMHELACDRGQGWLFGRPMEAAALQAWVASREALAA